MINAQDNEIYELFRLLAPVVRRDLEGDPDIRIRVYVVRQVLGSVLAELESCPECRPHILPLNTLKVALDYVVETYDDREPGNLH
jgi:hypothetical protein